MRFVRLLAALALLMAFTVVPAYADVEVDAVSQNLMCQCGCTMVLNTCECGTAEQMRGDIKAMLGEGKTQQQILDFYVGKYGEKVLSAPTKQGFNLTAYITPFLGIVFAGGGIFLVVRQWVWHGKRTAMPEPSLSGTAADEQSGDLRPLLARELENYE